MRIFTLKNFAFDEEAARKHSSNVIYIFSEDEMVQIGQSGKIVDRCRECFKQLLFDPDVDCLIVSGPLAAAPLPLAVLALMFPGRALKTYYYIQKTKKYKFNQIHFPASLLPY